MHLAALTWTNAAMLALTLQCLPSNDHGCRPQALIKLTGKSGAEQVSVRDFGAFVDVGAPRHGLLHRMNMTASTCALMHATAGYRLHHPSVSLPLQLAAYALMHALRHAADSLHHGPFSAFPALSELAPAV